jgi:hypothetical protein
VTFKVRGGKHTTPAANVLALEWYGYPGRSKCWRCGAGLRYRVVSRDGNPRNLARANLKFAFDPETVKHELVCMPRIVNEWPEGTPWGTGDYKPGCLSPMVLGVA